MAIGAGAAGAWAATNATTHTVTLPAHATGNLLIVISACKAAAITSVNQSITTGVGWTRAAAFADGTLNSGNGTGSVNQAVFWKIATSGSETNPVITWGGGQTADPGIAVGLCFTNAGGSEGWWTPLSVLQVATNSATAISVNMGSNPGITAGDWGVIAHTTRDDSVLTVPSWTATSTTLAAVVEYPATAIATATGGDMAGDAAYRSVTSGTASAAPVVTGTQAAAETGVTCFIRLRVGPTARPNAGLASGTGTVYNAEPTPTTPPTKLYMTDVDTNFTTGNNDTTLQGASSGWISMALSPSRGNGVGSEQVVTVLGPVSGLEVGAATPLPAVWYSPPLASSVTISGSITWNLWADQNSGIANATIGGILEVVNGATGAFTEIDRATYGPELVIDAGGGSDPCNFSETPGAGVLCNKGDRLRVRVYADDATAVTMAASFQVGFDYAADMVGSRGDSWVGLNETITFVSEPAGTQMFLTNAASAVSTASVDLEARPSRGSGVVTGDTTQVAGWTSPLQATSTGGGTVIDWFTRPLGAFTLSGAARVNARTQISSGTGTSGSSVRCEIARVEADGSSATIWGVANSWPEVGTSQAVQSFLVGGDDLAVSDGQRLRLRFFFDDAGNYPMTNALGNTALFYYSGTSGGASGDAYVTFSQTLTELVAGEMPPRSRQIPQLLAH